jgi:hypothetical protein
MITYTTRELASMPSGTRVLIDEIPVTVLRVHRDDHCMALELAEPFDGSNEVEVVLDMVDEPFWPAA